jgi:hypothetical protein
VDPELGEPRSEAAGGEGRAVVRAARELAGLDAVHSDGVLDDGDASSARQRSTSCQAVRRTNAVTIR